MLYDNRALKWIKGRVANLYNDGYSDGKADAKRANKDKLNTVLVTLNKVNEKIVVDGIDLTNKKDKEEIVTLITSAISIVANVKGEDKNAMQ